MFNFVHDVPPINGRAYLDTSHVEELVDALLEKPNEWAQVPATYFYSDLEGSDEKTLKNKARSVANRINNRKDIKHIKDYPAEAKARDTNVYVRINLTRRQLREMELD